VPRRRCVHQCLCVCSVCFLFLPLRARVSAVVRPPSLPASLPLPPPLCLSLAHSLAALFSSRRAVSVGMIATVAVDARVRC
jgi:hypothetical protein